MSALDDGRFTLAVAAAAVGGRLHGADVAFDGVVTDSRGACHGQLFVALRGERFDGHDHVAAAAAAGAVAALVDHPLDPDLRPDLPTGFPPNFPQVVVDDTRLALGRLAAAWRDRIPARVVAITGSNGKTTVKEMVTAILSRCGPTRATQGNLNNDIGMPLTLLAARDEAWLILEMGANHHGEIAYLTGIGRPEVALITNAGRAHLEGFGSVEGVAHAKGEIATGLPADGTFVFMADVPWTPLWHKLAAGRRTLTFGTGPGAAVGTDENAITMRWDADGFRTCFDARIARGDDGDGEVTTLPIALGLAGRHNVRNALAAIAMATALGVPAAAITTGLAALQPVRRRLQPRRALHGPRLIDDSYNANPDSLAAAVDVLVGLALADQSPPASAGRRVLVLGDFGELGPDSAALHQAMGEGARAAGVDALYAVGPLAAGAVAGFGPAGRHFADQPALVAALLADTGADDLLLIKGSRASGMDRVADALCADAANGSA